MPGPPPVGVQSSLHPIFSVSAGVDGEGAEGRDELRFGEGANGDFVPVEFGDSLFVEHEMPDPQVEMKGFGNRPEVGDGCGVVELIEGGGGAEGRVVLVIEGARGRVVLVVEGTGGEVVLVVRGRRGRGREG